MTVLWFYYFPDNQFSFRGVCILHARLGMKIYVHQIASPLQIQ